jgi:pimeloyl-ACP methyl ester carboxylesterase
MRISFLWRLTRVVTQGGDWGCFITRVMGKVYPEAVKASHINFIMAGPSNFAWNPHRILQQLLTPLSSVEWAGVKRSYDYLMYGSGYVEIQSTRPQSLAYGLADSPVGVLGWLWEKLHDWTDNYAWTDDEILTWISIYWFSTAGPGASVRIYKEAKYPEDKSLKGDFAFWSWVPKIPLGLALFPRDILSAPRVMARTMGPVIHETVMESGGHFAAWEKPAEFAADLQKMFGRGGGGYARVAGRTGYVEDKKNA